MPNNNIFREAKQLLNNKPIEEMTQDEVLTVKAATIPLNILPQFNDKTTDEGLGVLARLFDEARNGEEKDEGTINTAQSTPMAKVRANQKD